MKTCLSFLALILLFSGCGHTKYTYLVEKGKTIDFSEGKWILNEVSTNWDKNRLQDIAVAGFGRILGDSLFGLDGLRKDRLVGSRLPMTPSDNELSDLKTGTDCDYLITIESVIIKSEMSSFPMAPDFGSIRRVNEARTIVKIYDLNKLLLISESTMVGKADVTKNTEDGDWDYVNLAQNIAMKSLSKTIQEYDRNRVK